MTKDEIQDKGLAAVLPYKRAGVGITMGGGKTLLGLKHMDHNYTDTVKFLVVAPKETIIATWKEQAVEHNLEYLLPHITFTTYLSLGKQDLDYDVVYLDECHSLLDSHDFWLGMYPNKILGLTGTPPKFQRSEKGKMVTEYCPIVFTYVTDEAVEDKLLNSYKIIVHTLLLDTNKNIKAGKEPKTWMTSEQGSYDYWSQRIDRAFSPKEKMIMRVMRMKAMMEFPSKEKLASQVMHEVLKTEDKCLLFCNTQKQADRLCSHSFHSGNPDSESHLEQFKNGRLKCLSCVLQLSEGVNIPNLKAGVIMHAYGNERKASQRIGRFLRLNPTDTATVHILCYKGTIDESWVRSALEDFDQTNVTWK